MASSFGLSSVRVCLSVIMYLCLHDLYFYLWPFLRCTDFWLNWCLDNFKSKYFDNSVSTRLCQRNVLLKYFSKLTSKTENIAICFNAKLSVGTWQARLIVRHNPFQSRIYVAQCNDWLKGEYLVWFTDGEPFHNYTIDNDTDYARFGKQSMVFTKDQSSIKISFPSIHSEYGIFLESIFILETWYMTVSFH